MTRAVLQFSHSLCRYMGLIVLLVLSVSMSRVWVEFGRQRTVSDRTYPLIEGNVRMPLSMRAETTLGN